MLTFLTDVLGTPKKKVNFSVSLILNALVIWINVFQISNVGRYVRIGNGNQLIRDPKKRARVLASEKVRWSLHTARLRLARKRKYCQFFTRFGKCNKDDGKCPYIHDSSKIAVCTKFLNGLCSNPNCKLTHKVCHVFSYWTWCCQSQCICKCLLTVYIDAFLMHRSFQKECRIALTFCKVILYHIVLLFKVLKGQSSYIFDISWQVYAPIEIVLTDT